MPKTAAMAAAKTPPPPKAKIEKPVKFSAPWPVKNATRSEL